MNRRGTGREQVRNRSSRHERDSIRPPRPEGCFLPRPGRGSRFRPAGGQQVEQQAKDRRATGREQAPQPQETGLSAFSLHADQRRVCPKRQEPARITSEAQRTQNGTAGKGRNSNTRGHAEGEQDRSCRSTDSVRQDLAALPVSGGVAGARTPPALTREQPGHTTHATARPAPRALPVTPACPALPCWPGTSSRRGPGTARSPAPDPRSRST
jgi:hypothetical protein